MWKVYFENILVLLKLDLTRSRSDHKRMRVTKGEAWCRSCNMLDECYNGEEWKQKRFIFFFSRIHLLHEHLHKKLLRIINGASELKGITYFISTCITI